MPNDSTLTAIDSPKREELFSASGFELAQRMATALTKSTLIPENFRNNLPNCLIALEMAQRMGASPMMVMQNLYIVHGKPAWSSQFVIAAINSTGRFSPLRFDMKGEGQNRECIAWAKELETGERLEGPAVSIAMAKAEGWLGKNGSKWQTMPELMLRYRSATFFGRLYAPEVLMGMKEEAEIMDVVAAAKPIAASSEISFGPAGVEPNGGEHTEAQPTEEKPKRHRRTKTEMEAARAGEKHSAEGGSGESQEEAGGSTAKPTTPAPPRATPLEGLRNLINTSPFKEPKESTFVKHLISNRYMEPSEKLGDLTEEKIQQIADSFMSLVSELVDAP